MMSKLSIQEKQIKAMRTSEISQQIIQVKLSLKCWITSKTDLKRDNNSDHGALLGRRLHPK